MTSLNKLKINIYVDGPNINSLSKLNNLREVKGFTTNPTLISKMNISYSKYAHKFLKIVKKKSSSFEVIADNKKNMLKEALIISKWAKNIYVKIPIVNSKGYSTEKVIQELSKNNVNLNITAIFTKKQLDIVKKSILKETKVIVSIFCGRIADTGRDPVEYVKYAKKIFKNYKNVQILWASPREVLNIFHAENSGCDIITITEDLFKKLSNLNKNLHQFSVDTVKMFVNDAKKSNLRINDY